MKKESIIIAGAGASGLMAARLLAPQFNITVLESRPVAGGRIRTIQSASGHIIEGGAEFVHGKLPLTLALLEEAGVGYHPAEGPMVRKEEGRWTGDDAMSGNWNKLIRRMESLATDMSLADFLNTYFPGQRYEALRHEAERFAGGFDLADPAKVSTKELAAEWKHQDENFRVEGGYGKLVDFLVEDCSRLGCRIMYGEAVNAVTHAAGHVTVTGASSMTYEGQKLIVTAPLPLLQPNGSSLGIQFFPSIENYLTASSIIGFGPVTKILFEFEKVFWPEQHMFFFGDAPIHTWWNQYPKKTPLLTGWCGYPTASRLARLSDEEIVVKGLQSLSMLFDLPEESVKNNLRQSFVFNWTQYPESRGGYSYPTLETAGARSILNHPVGNTLYFAGEGVYAGANGGTVEAALASGKEVANRILSHS